MTTLEFLTYLRSLDVKLAAKGDRLTCNAPEGVLTAELRGELKSRKPDLLALLRGDADAPTSALPPVAPASSEQPVPLSFAQERLWSVIAHAPDDAAYNMPIAFRLRGLLDGEALEASINEIVRRHDVLRTTFTAAEGGVRPVITPRATFMLPVLDLNGRPEAAQADDLAETIRRVSRAPFDLKAGPLYRIRLLRLSAREHVLVLVMHHIVSDGWSFDVFLRELSDLYGAYTAGRQSPLDTLPIQYADYSAWQRGVLVGEPLERLERYWREQMSGTVSVLHLPTDRRSGGHGYDGATQSVMLPASLTEQLNTLSRREGTTLFMTVLAAYQTLLYQHTGQTDLVLCSPAACRDQREVQGLIGYFNNVIVLRTDLSGAPSFRGLVERVRRTALGAYQHQDFPFHKLADFPNLARTPLTRGMFTLNQEPPHTLSLNGVEVESLPTSNGTSNFDLALSVQAHGPRMEARFTYKTALFDERTIAGLLRDFEYVLESVMEDPEQPIASVRPGLSGTSGDGLSGGTRVGEAAPSVHAKRGTPSFVEPRTALELQLVKLWEETLRTAPVSVRDDFFDLGGHSLLAAQLFERIEDGLGRRLPLATIFELSTVEALAGALEDEGWTPGWSALVPIRPGGAKPPLFAVHSWEGHVLFYRDFARHLDPDQPFYALQSIGLDGEKSLLRGVEEMAAQYIREIRSLQPHGPYHLTGRCFGATVAYEMAQQLVAEGDTVSALIALDGGFVGDRTYVDTTLTGRDSQADGAHHAAAWYDDLPRPLRRGGQLLDRIRGRLRWGMDELVWKFKWLTDAQYRRFKRVGWANREAARQYSPRSYPGTLTMVFTEERVAAEEKDRGLLSWRLIADETTLHIIPGDHKTIMTDPHVRALSMQVQRCLDEAQSTTTQTTALQRADL